MGINERKQMKYRLIKLIALSGRLNLYSVCKLLCMEYRYL